MEPLIELKNAGIQFTNGSGRKKQKIQALTGVNLTLGRGEIVAVVGESGCGKTTMGKLIVGIHKPTEGQVLYKGRDIWSLKGKDYHEYRMGVQMVHQDSYAALNPNKTIFQSLSLPLMQHHIVKTEKEALDYLSNLLLDVGLTPPAMFLEKYPHQLSGGQRQRLLLARALSVKPELIVADEPVSMVDVSMRISLLSLMARMKEKYNVSFLYITHDLGTARYIASSGRIVVMYLGRMIETNAIQRAIDCPMHPYFNALIAAVPEANPKLRGDFTKELPLRSLDLPNLLDLPKGCKFNPRCPYCEERCTMEEPVLHPLNGGLVACHRAEEILKLREAEKSSR